MHDGCADEVEVGGIQRQPLLEVSCRRRKVRSMIPSINAERAYAGAYCGSIASACLIASRASGRPSIDRQYAEVHVDCK